MYKTKESPSPSDTPSGVLFYNHFPSNFLRPYGVADSWPHDKTIFKRVNPKNCEWLIRPQVAMSEFAATINENMDFLATDNNALIQTEKFAEMQQILSGFLGCLERLNTRNVEKPNLADAKDVMKTILKDDDDVESFFDSMVKVGGAMFSMGIHYSVVKTLMTNPDEYAAKTVGTNKLASQFKNDPTIAGLKDFLTSHCCLESNVHASEPYRRVKKNLLHRLDSSDDESLDNTTPAATQSKDEPSKNKKHKRSSETNTATIDNPTTHIKVKPSKKKNKKRKKCVQKE